MPPKDLINLTFLVLSKRSTYATLKNLVKYHEQVTHLHKTLVTGAVEPHHYFAALAPT